MNPKQYNSSRFPRYGKADDRSLDLYLREIGETPLIDQEEEVRLAQRIKQGDKKALDKMVKANLRFVVAVAKQYQNQGLSLADLINEGNIGMIKAARRFDETRGFKFISYGVWWIRQAILQALAEQSRIVRIPLNRVGRLYKIGKTSIKMEQELGRQPSPEELADELDLDREEVANTLQIGPPATSLDSPLTVGESNSLIDVLEDEFAPSPEELIIQQELRVEIEKALDTLTPREAEVINLYFGLNHETALTLEEIGARFRLTRERVRQIKEKAIRRLKIATRSRELKRFFD